MEYLFGGLVLFLTAGFLWFYIVRPILEDYGIVQDGASVNDTAVTHTEVMSRGEESTPPSRPSSLQTDSRQTADRPAPGRAELLTLYSLMREARISREKARPALKAVGLPLDNNLWAEAASPADDDDVLVTPYAGRRTKASYYSDPELEYQPPR